MPDFTALPIPYVPIGTQAAAVRSAIDAAQLSGDNSFGGLQNLAIRGPFLSDAEADANGVPVDNLYYQPNGTVRAASHLSLDLQFATDKTLTARVGPTPTFIRASGATYVGSDGLIQSAAVDEPRFDHDPVTLACKGLLIEEGRTNVALYSGAIVNGTGWNTAETTSTASGTGPDGNTAYQISETALTFSHSLINTGTLTPNTNGTSTVLNTVYTGSIFLKKVAGSVEWIQLSFGAGGFGTSQYANFNLSTGAYGSFAGLTAGTVPRIEAFPNGWYRCSITVTAIATTTTSAGVVVAFTNNTDATTRLPSYSGTTANSVLAAMGQLEAGSFPTSYIPTTTAPLTRSADVCNITGGNFTSLYNATEGTFFLTASTFSPNTNIRRIVFATDGTAANRAGFLFNNVGQPTTFVASSGGSLSALIASPVSSITAPVKIAGAYKVDDFAISANGSTVTNDTSGLVGVGINRLNIGSQNDTELINGHIAAIRYYKKRLPDAKLQALTV
jgi:hypothetical protein